MKYEFLWEMDSGEIGNYSVHAASEYDAKKTVEKEAPEVINCLIKIQVNE